jgi:hypothetical protein
MASCMGLMDNMRPVDLARLGDRLGAYAAQPTAFDPPTRTRAWPVCSIPRAAKVPCLQFRSTENRWNTSDYSDSQHNTVSCMHPPTAPRGRPPMHTLALPAGTVGPVRSVHVRATRSTGGTGACTSSISSIEAIEVQGIYTHCVYQLVCQ